MLIENIFEKPINREIDEVIRADENKFLFQEFDEFVVTDELLKYFDKFFQVYSKEINDSHGNIGVWISGFFGSGKSHFLKILSYILNNKEINGKKPIDFFIKDEKITDKRIISNMLDSINGNKVILFNIANMASKDDDILDIFLKVFNEMRGYSSEFPFLADIEKQLDNNNLFDDFKTEFKKINGNYWEDVRDNYYSLSDDVIQTFVNINFMNSIEEANNWRKKAEDNYNYSINQFTDDVKEYVKNNKKRVIFAIDEVGQFIANNDKLMLNLQTIVEGLSTKCDGKAWVFVTSQQSIMDVYDNENSIHDFSKIQGRFQTRFILSSSNVDDVIKNRLLLKKDTVKEFLKEEFIKNEPIFKNIISFNESADMKIYNDYEDYVNIYPIIPYQFELIQKALMEIRFENISAGYIPEGERSMLGIFKKSIMNISENTTDKLVPLYEFFEPFSEYIDHTHKINIHRAEENKKLDEFDVNVLKTLFLIKFLDEKYIKPTSRNLSTLMISNINEDIIDLENKINISLDKLINQVFVHKIDYEYYYLTKKEQDINREIRKQKVSTENIVDYLFNNQILNIYPNNKLKIGKRYKYNFDLIIDNEKGNNNLVMRIITPYFDHDDDFQSTLTSREINLKHLSEKNNEVIIQLDSNRQIYDEITEKLQIDTFLKNKDEKELFNCDKVNESIEKGYKIRELVNESIINSIVYIKGNKFISNKRDPEGFFDEILNKLFHSIYNKWTYLDFNPKKEDIIAELNLEYQSKLDKHENKHNIALTDMENYIGDNDTVSLNKIFSRYSNVPYGFIKEDVSWIISALFSQKRISLILNDNEIFLDKNNIQDIYDNISGKNSIISKNLLISKRKSINPKKIKVTRDIYKELSDDNKKYSDELLMKKFKHYIYDNKTKISKYAKEIKSNDKYPGMKILNRYEKLSDELLNYKKLFDFYSFVYDNKQEFYEYMDDLDNVFDFYETNKKEIFDESCKISYEFDKNELFLESSKLKENILEIKSIIEMEEPYSKIKSLLNLNNEYYIIFNPILKNEQKNLLNHIDEDYEYLLSMLDDKSEGMFKDQIEDTYSKLKRWLDSDRDINSIRGKIINSNDFKKNFVKKINEFNKKDEIGININDLIDNEIMIYNNEDLDEFLYSIENKIKENLKDNNSIKIIK